MDMDIHGTMDIHRKSVDMDMDMDVKFHIHVNPGNFTGRVLSRRPGFGEIASIGGADDGGLGAVPSTRSRGRAPGQGV